MGMLVGFHAEGWDHLILRAFTASLLSIAEDDIVPDVIEARRGWELVLQTVPAAVERFYSQCAQFAVFGIDNDGNVDLTHAGTHEELRPLCSANR